MKYNEKQKEKDNKEIFLIIRKINKLSMYITCTYYMKYEIALTIKESI